MAITKNNKIEASDITTSLNEKAPTSHASSATTYGIGTDSNYGHTKLSDATNSTSSTSAGIAATPKAVKTAYDLANTAKTTADSAAIAAENAGPPTNGTGIAVDGKKVSLATYGTAGSYGPSANATPAFGATFDVPYITTDAYGRVTASTKTVKIPALSGGVNPKAYITATYRSGDNWYRKYSDGWIEQGGVVTSVNQDSYTNWNLVTPFTSTSYTILMLSRGSPNGYLNLNGVTNRYTSYFTLSSYEYTTGRFWYACGF